MTVKVGINGFGRIGRNVFRAAVENRNIDFVAVNDLPVPTSTLAHLLKYDSILGELKVNVEAREGQLVVNGKEVKVLNHKDPAEIPWKDFGVDIVIESSGVFTDKEKCIECGICHSICPVIHELDEDAKELVSWTSPMGRVQGSAVARATNPQVRVFPDST